MDNFEKFAELLSNRRHFASKSELASQCQISERTVQRYIAQLKQQGAKIERQTIDHKRGYRMTDSFLLAKQYSDAASMRALALMFELLDQLGYCAFQSGLSKLREELKRLTRKVIGSDDMIKCLTFKAINQRQPNPQVMAQVSQALLSDQKLHIEYQSRSSDRSTTREVSPKQIELYRGNWYLLAYCHLRTSWRYFAMEQISAAELLDTPTTANGEPPKTRGYGIFDLETQHRATLKFSPFRARWIQDELWHRAQLDTLHEDGSLTREFPFGEATELVRDLMREGKDVQVIAPEFLRDLVRKGHREALQ